MLVSYQATDIGLVRRTNEDSAAVFAPDYFVVADGMGGQAAGEVASQMLVQSLRRSLSNRDAVDAEGLEAALLEANQEILATAQQHPEYQGMGTTATLLHGEGNMAYWAHVGDSRLYLYREGSLRQVTKDHTYVERLKEEGQLTEAEARVHPQKNMLLRAVGVEDNLRVDTGSFELCAGDVILLATDGLMKHVEDESLAAFLDRPDEQVAARLVAQALSAGGTDNVTVVVVVKQDEA